MQPVVEQLRKLIEVQPDIAGFYRKSMELVANRLAAQAVVVWDCSRLPWHPLAQHNRDTGQPVKVGMSQPMHVELLERSLDYGRACIANKEKADKNASNILTCPIPRGNERDLVEVFVAPELAGEEIERCRVELESICNAIGDSLANARFSESTQTADESGIQGTSFNTDQLDRFAANVYRSIDHRETCFNIVNESQSLLKCDRVSVLRFDGKSRLLAISGLPRFNRRSNAIRGLERLVEAVLETGQPFWYPGTQDDCLPQIGVPLDDYLATGVTRSLVIVPLREHDGDVRLSPEEIRRERKNPVVGGIVFENFTGEWQQQQMLDPISLICRHAGAAYRNSLVHRKLFLYPLWRSLGRLQSVARPGNLSKTIMVMGLILVLLASLFVVPSQISISGKGELVPKVRRKVFATVGGQITDIDVRHGDTVDSGATLIRMTSSQLEMKINQVMNRIDLTRQQIDALDKLRLAGAGNHLNGEEVAQADLERVSLAKQLENLEIERAILEGEQEQLMVTSPIDGQVTTVNIDERLRNRPVEPGQVLLDVADTRGEWIIEMDLPDRRIGHLLRARRRLHETGGELKATFILAADPGRMMTGTVYDVALATQVKQSTGQTVRVKIRLDDPDATGIRQVGTQVSIKIDCGDCSLGYAWFHDLGEFVQSRVLFYLR